MLILSAVRRYNEHATHGTRAAKSAAPPVPTMTEFLSGSLQALFNAIALNVVRVLAYPINPGERLFVIYLTTSFLMAAAVWKWTARRRSQGGENRSR